MGKAHEGSSHRRASAPIVVAVTGHRDISPTDPALISIVSRELTKLVRSQGGPPVVVLTGLAEGADRLAIEAARRAVGAQFWAVLPLPDALYVNDFTSPASLADYKSLKAQAQRVIEAPLMASRRQLSGHGAPRDHQYAWAGAYLAKRAQVLIAIWDGAPARGTGGTAQVVDWFLANKTPRAYRIAQAPRIAARREVARTLIHIDPETHKVRRLACPPTSRPGRQA
jgi:hypothetical protein